MEWYDSLLILLALIGIFMAFFGSYHGQGKRKSGVVGWILVILALIIKAAIWFARLI